MLLLTFHIFNIKIIQWHVFVWHNLCVFTTLCIQVCVFCLFFSPSQGHVGNLSLYINILLHQTYIWILKKWFCVVVLCLSSNILEHRYSQFLPIAYVKRNSVWMFGSTVCCYWILNNNNVPPIKIHRWMVAIYGEESVDVSTVIWWVRQLKDKGE